MSSLNAVQAVSAAGGILSKATQEVMNMVTELSRDAAKAKGESDLVEGDDAVLALVGQCFSISFPALRGAIRSYLSSDIQTFVGFNMPAKAPDPPAGCDKENPKAKDGPGPAPGSAQHAFFLLLAFYESASNLIAQVMSMTTYNRSCRKRLFEDLGFADTLAAYIYELVAAEGILNLWDPKGRIIQHYETRCPHFYGIFLLSPALMVFDMYLVERSKAVAAHFDAPNRKEQGLPLLFTLEGVPLPRTLNSSRLPSSLFEGLLDSLQRLIKRMENPATFEYYRNPDFRITEIMNGVIFRIAKMHGAPMTIKDHADVMRAKGKDAPLVCDGCGTKPAKDAKLSKCARCKVRWYCSRECQTTDWSSHKASCFAAE